jgi:plastocyanin domain-containing protein
MKPGRLFAAILAFSLTPTAALSPAAAQEAPAREVEIIVDGGYRPDLVTARAGERLRLKFVRHEDGSCTREVVFPTLDIRKELPPHQPVFVDLPALAAGEYEFRCGMKMIRGRIVVEPAR